MAARKPEAAGTGFPPEAPEKGYSSPAETFLDSWHPRIRKQQMCDIWSHCTWSNFLQQQEETVTLTFATVSVASGLSGSNILQLQTFQQPWKNQQTKKILWLQTTATSENFHMVIGIWYHRTDNLLLELNDTRKVRQIFLSFWKVSIVWGLSRL